MKLTAEALVFDDNILAVFAVFCLQLALVGVGDPITAAHLQHMKAWGKTLPKSGGKYSFPKSTGDKLSLGALTRVHTFPTLWCSDPHGSWTSPASFILH